MRGTTWQPVPGVNSDHVPVEIHLDGTAAKREEEDKDSYDDDTVPTVEDKGVQVRSKIVKFADIRVSSRDTARYGCTPGCPACKYVVREKKIPPGIAHSEGCRKK